MNPGEELFDEFGEDSEGYQPSNYDGERTYTPDVAIPIWEDAASYGGETYRLRIQRQNMDGTRSDLGHIAGDASEAFCGLLVTVPLVQFSVMLTLALLLSLKSL